MKLSSILVALVATSSFAYDSQYAQPNAPYQWVRYSLDVGGVFTIPTVWPSNGTDSKLGLGVRLVPSVEYSVTERFAMQTFVGYEFTTWGYKFQDATGYKEDVDVKSHFLTIGFAGQFNSNRRQGFVSLGLSGDIPLRSDLVDAVDYGDGTSDSYNGRFHGDQSQLFLDLGFGHQISPALAFVAGYRFPLVPYYDADGLTLNLHQINLGLRFSML
jgi:hypothetical protein